MQGIRLLGYFDFSQYGLLGWHKEYPFPQHAYQRTERLSVSSLSRRLSDDRPRRTSETKHICLPCSHAAAGMAGRAEHESYRVVP
jgi:hypothetical protein